MKLNLNLDYAETPATDKGARLSNAETTALILKRMCETKYATGLPRPLTRMWQKILHKFDEKTAVIEVDETQMDFLSELVDDEKVELPPVFTPWLLVVIDHFDSLKKEGEKEPGLSAVK